MIIIVVFIVTVTICNSFRHGLGACDDGLGLAYISVLSVKAHANNRSSSALPTPDKGGSSATVLRSTSMGLACVCRMQGHIPGLPTATTAYWGTR